MAYIPARKGFTIGDEIVLTKDHESLAGKFEKGTKVKIIDFDIIGGYAIQEEFGNRMIDIGWEP
jgi:hypothetical protein